jgi:hypothetical protein
MVNITKPAGGLREELGAAPPRRRDARFVTQSEVGDGVATAFAVAGGFEPFAIFVAGVYQHEGAGEDYTVAYDGFEYSVLFAVAPALDAPIAIQMQWGAV